MKSRLTIDFGDLPITDEQAERIGTYTQNGVLRFIEAFGKDPSDREMHMIAMAVARYVLDPEANAAGLQ